MFQNKLTYNKTLTGNNSSEAKQLSKGSSSYDRVEREMNGKVKDYNSIREIVLQQMEKTNSIASKKPIVSRVKETKKNVSMQSHQKMNIRTKK